jgi:hypothetical protein
LTTEDPHFQLEFDKITQFEYDRKTSSYSIVLREKHLDFPMYAVLKSNKKPQIFLFHREILDKEQKLLETLEKKFLNSVLHFNHLGTDQMSVNMATRS